MTALTWVSDHGTLALHEPPFGLVSGLANRGAPPVQATERELLSAAGSVLTLIRDQARTVDVPVRIDSTDLRAVLRDAAAVLRGQGRLVDGDRELICRYVGGLEWDEQLPNVMTQMLSFRAFDPYWRDTTPTVQLIDISVLEFLSATVNDPWFPWYLVDDTAIGGFRIDNDGDVDGWPVWTVQGPGGPTTLTNDTTGAVLEVATVLAEGEQLHIDTRPGVKTVTGPDGQNLFADLSTTSSLWPLVRGVQQVTVELPNAAAGTSNVRMSYRRRFLTA